jgi:enoyl-CoA hydratase
VATLVRQERRERVALLTLSDPDRRNAMTLPMVEEIVDALHALEADPEVGALVVTGEPPAFCSGADVANLGALAAGATAAERTRITRVYEGFLRVLRSPLPTVAAVNGPAVGAGMNLALACDVRIAGESARFDPRFLRIGLHPGGGHVWMLERAVGPQAAAAMILFGQVLEGADAAARGLAWECVPDDDVVDFACELAARAAMVPEALAARTKETLRAAAFQPGFDEAVAFEVGHQTWSLAQGWFAPRR